MARFATHARRTPKQIVNTAYGRVLMAAAARSASTLRALA
jgi:hypothetical protein